MKDTNNLNEKETDTSESIKEENLISDEILEIVNRRSSLSDLSDLRPSDPEDLSDEEEKNEEDTDTDIKSRIVINEGGSGDHNDSENNISDSEPKKNVAKSIGDGLKKKIKESELLKADTFKDMFFGTQDDGLSDKRSADDGQIIMSDADDIEEFDDYEPEDKNDPVLFDKSRKKRITADPNQDKIIFSCEYMVTPDQALDGYMLFYNEFVKSKNIKWTLAFGVLAVLFLISIVASGGYLNYLLMIVCLSVIAIKWLNSYSAKKNAVYSADDVKNDSYKLTFYNSRIVIEESELAGDKIYNYQPVMIRFEDIDLKVIDYEDLYVLVFKKDYIYTVPKDCMDEQMNEIFSKHLTNILGDDYFEYYSKAKKNKASQGLAKGNGNNNNEEQDGKINE